MIYGPKQLADTLLLDRQKNGLIQVEIAKKVGIKQATVSNFENNPEKCSLATMFKIIQALNLHLEINEKRKDTLIDDEDW